ncbi:MAG: branched-chain amino acid ABC transporter substrate-binding protein [Cellvibrionales bacterium]|jgi:branched-chain amino acid transport system substrate-binding protein|nr:branched-chain amino acid ABC transporter substrate-binding protein [Cellvibrionales bacterium]
MSPRFIATLCIAVCTILATACGKQDAATASSPAESTTAANTLTVRIGHAAPLTGPQAHLGKDNENAIRLAIDELNAEKLAIGGKIAHFELLSEDDMADPRTATQVAQKLADAGISGMIGHLNSGTSIPASKIYHDAGLVQISPSATAIAYTAQGFPGVFRVMANDSQQGKQLAHYAVQTLGMNKLAIIDDRTAYGQGLADVFEKTAVELGATVVKREFTTDKSTDFNAILTSVKGSDAQLLFYGGMDAQGAPMVKQMRALGISIPLMGGDGLYTAEFLKLAGSEAEGVIGSLPGIPLSSMQGGPEFKQKFEAQYGVIQLYAPYVYDAMRMMAKAMQQANSIEPSQYRPVLASMEYSGLTSTIRFDDKGDLVNSPVSIYQVHNGAWQFLKTAGGQ